MIPAWLNQDEYPFRSHYANIGGQELHYIDEGEGETLLFVHGTPSWSFDFRNVIKKLRSKYRCVAIDHIGFGLSSKPESYDYSTQNHSRTLEKFIAKMGLENFTLIVHDFGGPIGLNIAIQYPEKINRLVILNSWLWSNETDPDFIKLKKVLRSPLLPFLYRYVNFSPRFILPASFGEHTLSKKLLSQYINPFSNKSQRNGVLAFAQSLLNDQAWFESLWARKQEIARKPALFIWGMQDPVLKPKHLQKFISGFPQASVKRLEACGHFPQEEQPDQVAEFIHTFMLEQPTVPNKVHSQPHS